MSDNIKEFICDNGFIKNLDKCTKFFKLDKDNLIKNYTLEYLENTSIQKFRVIDYLIYKTGGNIINDIIEKELFEVIQEPETIWWIIMCCKKNKNIDIILKNYIYDFDERILFSLLFKSYNDIILKYKHKININLIKNMLYVIENLERCIKKEQIKFLFKFITENYDIVNENLDFTVTIFDPIVYIDNGATPEVIISSWNGNENDYLCFYDKVFYCEDGLPVIIDKLKTVYNLLIFYCKKYGISYDKYCDSCDKSLYLKNKFEKDFNTYYSRDIYDCDLALKLNSYANTDILRKKLLIYVLKFEKNPSIILKFIYDVKIEIDYINNFVDRMKKLFNYDKIDFKKSIYTEKLMNLNKCVIKLMLNSII